MSDKKVGFDCRYIKPDSQDGISRFSSELFKALSKDHELTAIISDERQLEVLPAGVSYFRIQKPTSVLEPLSALRLNRKGFDAVFSPMQTIGSFGKRFRLILTVHDLIYYTHPKPPGYFNPVIKFLWRLYHKSFWPQKLLLSAADEVVTVSHTTKDLINQNRLTNKPITVVYNAASQIPIVRGRTERKIVYMGSFMPYKNVEDLIEAIADLPDYKLVLLSKINQKDRERLQSLADRLNAKVEFENGVTDSTYAQHLASATALVHASSDEGFGIPIIEAMSVGCPVVCSDIPIFREIADKEGLFFNIGDKRQLIEQIQVAAETREQRKANLIKRAKTFSWDNSAEDLARLLF